MIRLEVLLTLFVAPGVFCCIDYFDTGCHYPQGHLPKNETNCSSLNLPREAVIWFDDPSGRLDVTFPLYDVKCGIDCYNLELYVYETLSEEDCGWDLNPYVTSHMLPHSKRKYATVESCPDGDHSCQQICGEVGKMTFQYVFTGCYQLVVQPKSKESTRMKSYSWGKFLNTNYSKKFVAGTEPNVKFQNLPALLSTQVTIAFAPLIYNHPHTTLIKLRENIDVKQEEACYKTGIDHTACSVNNTSCQCSTSYSNHQQLQCSIRENQIYLVFIGLSPGNYCLYMDVTEERCQEGTLWTRPPNSTCNWNYPFEVKAEQNNPSHPEYFSRYYIILGAVCAVVVAAIVIALVAMRSYIARHHSRTTLTVLPNSLIPLQPSRILLLYARDCQPFMVLMATFREVLEDLAKCEVIDCLDASRWNEIGRSPVDWIRNHIEQLGTKVVLVATPCAYLRQQAHNKQVTTHYKDPASHDNLFIYALKTLMDNLSPDVYRKVCVVRFEGFSDDRNLFSHLTPYMRFVLPLHLHQLVSNLRPSASPEQNEQLIENKEVQKLTQDLTQLINYKNKNMNYLQDILSIQRNDES